MSACPHGDPTCPCQDGDYCHYEPDPGAPTEAGKLAWPCYNHALGLPCPECDQSAAAVIVGTLAGVAQARAKRRRR